MCRLKTYEVTPPGGYPYREDDGRKFAASPMIEDTAKSVASYRAANNRPRASVREALEDVDRYTCQRLGNMPQWCLCNEHAEGQIALGSSSPIVSGCKGCGARV